MLALDQEFAQVRRQPTAERLKALKRIIPCSTIKGILKEGGYERPCRRLPKWFMVWFVVGLGLFASDCYRQIFRWLQPFRRKATPLRSTLCEARQRLGVAPLRRLYERVVRWLATRRTPAAWYRHFRLMAVDGFVVDVPDTPANARIFGRPQGGRAPGAFPQARVLALCELGTHVLGKCLIKPIRCAEIRMVQVLLRYLSPPMLLLWDRGFLSFANLRQLLGQSGQLLGRVKKNWVFTKLEVLADGSYLAKLYRSTKDRRHDRDGLLVRIIEYTFRDQGRPGSGQFHRLLTTLRDARLDPAKRLITLYHERWEEELAIDELKTHQRQRPVLRSQTPAGVVQEIYALLVAHFVVRALLFEAAATQQLPPRRLSFTGALKILRCRLPECPRQARGQRRWYKDLLAEIAEETLGPRRERINPRVIKCKMSKWPKKKPEHRRNPQPAMKFGKAIEIIR